MSTRPTEFGKTADGTVVQAFELRNRNGVVAKIITYGARLAELHVPDKSGKTADVVLGFDNLKQYLEQDPFFGTSVGRYANRIAGGSFELDGKTYTLPKNNGNNTLHGGNKGWDKKVWKAEPLDNANSVKFTCFSPDGEEGFPGNVNASVTYTLDDRNELRIDYGATTDKATPINMTNHSYFNLAGAGNGDVLGHILTLHAEQYTPVDEGLIPTGEIASVKGTPLDFTKPTAIGAHIAEVKIGGYDHNFVLPGGGEGPVLAAVAREPKSGRVMEVRTTQPGVQFYTGNFLDGKLKGIGGAYPKHGGFCLETQHFPDSVHHANFPSAILRPGQTYRQTTTFRFSAE